MAHAHFSIGIEMRPNALIFLALILSGAHQGWLAVLKCLLIRNVSWSYANPEFNRSKSLCGATRAVRLTWASSVS
jgi:hypothetical protein